ncbi:MAG TPA: U32 family peptidase [Victivallales bacterium]|nr:U32 family peptidase [Victivallales bacterium]
MTSKVEVLSPAGSFESLYSAINAGADSVYFGAGNLNMRSRSSYNFSIKDIEKVVQICNKNNVNSYLALNTVIYDDELIESEKILYSAKYAGVTAVIASDMAVIMKAHSMGLSVHISVQANISNIGSVRFFAQYANVMVMARELSLKQIKDIADTVNGVNGNPILGPNGNPVRIEVFTHGALCVSVSGKCYMSLAQYNTSANRGACYQNCRRSYRVIDETDGSELVIDNKYVMSPKDICLIRYLDRILEAGVSILKLEGRGRAPDYVHTVTKVYREAVDSISKNQYTKENIDNWEKELSSVFNRGFWHGGYYMGKALDMWSDQPDNKAAKKKTRIGIITNFFSKINIAEITLKEGNISVGDEILIIGSTTGTEKLTVKEIRLEDKKVNEAGKGDIVSIPVERRVRRNDQVYILTLS